MQIIRIFVPQRIPGFTWYTLLRRLCTTQPEDLDAEDDERQPAVIVGAAFGGVFGAGIGAFVDRARAKKEIQEMVEDAEERRRNAPVQKYGEETQMLEDPKAVLQQEVAEKKASQQ